ncbi:MAG: hypothetical protein KGZ35_05780 [Truepera sp.]|nr:hypothetical protein [Truepera sp.]
MKGLFGVLLLGALIALPACQLPIFPGATWVDATNDGARVVSTDLLSSGERVVYAIRISPAVAGQNQLLYLEVEVLNERANVSITAHDFLGRAYAQSDSPDYFFEPAVSRTALAATGEPPMTAQGIGVEAFCRGPCILQPAQVGIVFLKIENTGIVSTDYRLFAFTEVYADVNEPTNNTNSGRVEFSGLVRGALETLGDVDFYVTQEPVRSIRITGAPTVTVAPRAVLFNDDTGGDLGDITAGTGNYERIFRTPIRVRIQVFSGNDRAGPSGSSFYEITTTP